LTVADDDPVDPAHLPRLDLDVQATGGADEGERSLRPGTGDLQRRGASRLGERAMREEGTAPRGLGVTGGTGDDLGGQTPHRPTALVDESRLAREGLAVVDDA